MSDMQGLHRMARSGDASALRIDRFQMEDWACEHPTVAGIADWKRQLDASRTIARRINTLQVWTRCGASLIRPTAAQPYVDYRQCDDRMRRGRCGGMPLDASACTRGGTA